MPIKQIGIEINVPTSKVIKMNSNRNIISQKQIIDTKSLNTPNNKKDQLRSSYGKIDFQQLSRNLQGMKLQT